MERDVPGPKDKREKVILDVLQVNNGLCMDDETDRLRLVGEILQALTEMDNAKKNMSAHEGDEQ
jgi:hypothetical protein